MKFLKMMVLVIVAALGLTACGGGGGGGGGSVTPPPSNVPTGVGATAGANKATVSWNAVNNATSYKIYYGTTSSLTKANAAGTISASPTTRTQDVTGLVGDVAYYFGVTATVNGVESDLSTVVTATPVSIASPAYVIATPGSYTPQGGSPLPQVSLSWGAVTGASTYRVYYSMDPGIDISTSSTYATVSTNSYVDDNTKNTGLSLENAEYYVVTAIVGGVESAPTDEVAAVPSTAPTPAAPAGVRGNTQNVFNSVDIYVSWIADPDASATYNVYYSKFPIDPTNPPSTKLTGVVTSSNSTNITQISGKSTIKTRISLAQLTGLSQADLDSGIYFAVTATNANGESQISPETAAYTPVFTDFLISGKTVTYTDDASAAGAATFSCNTDGTTTMLKSSLVLPINGANVTVPGTGAGTWSTNGGDLTLTFSNGTTISVYFGSIILSEGIAYVTVDATNMPTRTGILTFQ